MKPILFLALAFLSSTLTAQTCTGNLGENIFEEGDFGTGTSNLIGTNPNIAPGYNYTTNVPPFDGAYTITNNTGAWPNGFPSWLDIPDNSPDPFGYFMVVNASFGPGLFYTQEVEGLCEGTLYTFTADVINMIRSGVADHIAPNISFLIDGVEQYNTGDVPQSNAWINYGFNFVTGPSQTTVTLSLRNNAPGGNGNDVGLDNINFRACGPLAEILPQATEFVCEDGLATTITATISGDQFPNPAVQWQQSLDEGLTWNDLPGETNLAYDHIRTTNGSFYYRYLIANSPQNLTSAKCRVASNIKVIEVLPKLFATIDTICEGNTYFSEGNEYTQSGSYRDTLLSSLGCDSIIALDLTVLPDPNIQLDVEITNPECTEAAGSLFIASVTNGNPPYNYFIDDAPNPDGALFTGLVPGTYRVAIEDRYGCREEEEASLAIPTDFAIDLGPDQRILLGETAQLRATATEEIVDFAWVPELPNCPPDCSALEITPAESGFYRLVATSGIGCLASDSVFIEVVKVRQVYIPNAFSPNFDGVNDVFLPFANTPNVQEIRSLRIFDRWGATVYEATNAAPNSTAGGWRGLHRGKMVDTGVYIYAAEVVFLDGFIGRYEGTVTVLP